MFTGVGDINPDGQHFQIFCQFEQTKILNWILTTLHWIHGRIVVNACVKYRKKIFIGVGDIHPDGQPRTDGRTAGRTDRAQIIIPHKNKFF